MLKEFIFEHKVYALSKEVNPDATNEVVVLFKQLDSAQAFFRSILNDRFACEDLMSAAKWLGITNFTFPKQTCPQEAQSIIEQLCLKIWAGDLFLVEIRPVQKIGFEECCTKSLNAIKSILESGKILGKALLSSKLVLLFFSHQRGSKLFDAAKKAYDLRPTNPESDEWVLLAKAMLAVPKTTRKRVYDITMLEIRDHIKDNNRELRLFWEGVRDATVE